MVIQLRHLTQIKYTYINSVYTHSIRFCASLLFDFMFNCFFSFVLLAQYDQFLLRYFCCVAFFAIFRVFFSSKPKFCVFYLFATRKTITTLLFILACIFHHNYTTESPTFQQVSICKFSQKYVSMRFAVLCWFSVLCFSFFRRRWIAPVYKIHTLCIWYVVIQFFSLVAWFVNELNLLQVELVKHVFEHDFIMWCYTLAKRKKTSWKEHPIKISVCCFMCFYCFWLFFRYESRIKTTFLQIVSLFCIACIKRLLCTRAKHSHKREKLAAYGG